MVGYKVSRSWYVVYLVWSGMLCYACSDGSFSSGYSLIQLLFLGWIPRAFGVDCRVVCINPREILPLLNRVLLVTYRLLGRTRNGMGVRGLLCAYVQYRSSYRSLQTYCREPFGRLGEDHLLRVSADHPPVCPCRSAQRVSLQGSQKWGSGQNCSHISTVLTFLSIRFFFLEPSSCATPRFDFTPFSSPGTGPDSRRRARRGGLGFLKVWYSVREKRTRTRLNTPHSSIVGRWSLARD